MSGNDYDGSSPFDDDIESACFAVAAQNGITEDRAEMCSEDAMIGCINCPWRDPCADPYVGDALHTQSGEITVVSLQERQGNGGVTVIWVDANGTSRTQCLGSFQRDLKGSNTRVMRRGEKPFPFPLSPENMDESGDIFKNLVNHGKAAL